MNFEIYHFITSYNYYIIIFLMISGLFIVVSKGNMVKKLVGLALFQTSVYILYISPGKIVGEVQEKHRAMMERAQKSYVRRSVAYKADLNDVTDNFKYKKLN